MSNKEMSRRPINARDTRWAAYIAALLARKGIKPNQISLLSVVFAGLAGGCLLWSPYSSGFRSVWFLLSALFIQCRLLCNLFDGMVAIEGGFKTKSGSVFNDLPDRIADPVILISAGYAVTAFNAGVIAGWLAGLLSVLTAYVRFLGVAAGATEFFIGPMAKQHRMAVMTVSLIGAAIAAPWACHEQVILSGLVVVCVGCLLTVLRRVKRIINELESE
jgi:phosphatidylglycerophosphate synthase